MTDDVSKGTGYPERNKVPDYQGDYGSPGEIAGSVDGVLRSILHELQAPIVRPSAQIVLNTAAAADTVTNIFNTHIRYRITHVVIPAALTSPMNILLGTNKILSVGAITIPLVIPCEFIIENGVDVSAVSQTGALFATAPITILLVGEIIN